MVDIPTGDTEILRDRLTGKPVVRIVGWISARDSQLKTGHGKCLREPDVPKNAVQVMVYFFDAKTRQVYGMAERKPSLGSRGVARSELGLFKVEC